MILSSASTTGLADADNGFGQIDEGIVNRMRRRVAKMRTELTVWQTRVNRAEYNLNRSPKNRGRQRALERARRELNAKQGELNNETKIYEQARRELEQQRAAEAAAQQSAPSGDSGGGEEAPAEAPAEEEPAVEGLMGFLESLGQASPVVGAVVPPPKPATGLKAPASRDEINKRKLNRYGAIGIWGAATGFMATRKNKIVKTVGVVGLVGTGLNLLRALAATDKEYGG